MINITQSAIDNIAAYFTDKQPSPVRVFLNSGG